MTVALLTPDSENFRRARDIFLRALELNPDQREAFIVEACGSNSALLEQVRKLLDANGRNEHFLEHPIHKNDSASHLASYLPAGRMIGQYRIERILGEGGMGVVYLATDVMLKQFVALKEVSPAYTHDPERRARLIREAQAAASLNFHPGIATVYTLADLGEHFFIVYEYVDGETLRAEIARGPVPAPVIIDTAIAIGHALAAAHDKGIVHRDLKPENVMRTRHGGIKVLDFGLARQTGGDGADLTLTVPGGFYGTAAYMAPEQAQGQRDVDGRIDLFALGVVMYEMATGVNPFAADSLLSTIERIKQKDPPPLVPSSHGDRPMVFEGEPSGPALSAIIHACLRKDPGARLGSARDLVAALERAKAGRGSDLVSRTASRPSPDGLRWWKFHQVATCVAYAGLAVLMGLARSWFGGPLEQGVFFGTLGAVVAACVLRLHLWFTAASMPGEWRRQHRSAIPWLKAADAAFAAGLVVMGLLVMADSEETAAVLVCAGVICALSFALIEPATTRAAFGEPQ